MSLIEMSITGAILILFIIVLRALIIHHLPKMTFMILWCICMVRLLIPVSFSSQFSLYTFLNSPIKVNEMKSINSAEIVDKQPTKIVEQTDILSKGTTDDLVDNKMENVKNHIGTIIWSVGFILFASYFIISYINYKKKFRISLPVENAYINQWKKELRTIRKIDIRISDRILAPLTYGIVRPVILLPKKINWEDKKTLNYILTHEYVHIRRLDAIIKVILAITLCIHWFNPLVWVMYILANRDIELSCDEIVVYKFGETKKTLYALTLIGMEETKTKSLSLYNHFSRNAIEERITAIMKTKRISKLACGVALVLIVSTVVVFSTSATGANRQKSIEENEIKLATVNTTTLKVFEQPTKDSVVLTLVSEGDVFEVIEESDKWVKILVDNIEEEEPIEGYVSKEFVITSAESKKKSFKENLNSSIKPMKESKNNADKSKSKESLVEINESNSENVDDITFKEVENNTNGSKSNESLVEINGSNNDNVDNSIFEEIEDNTNESKSEESLVEINESTSENVDNSTLQEVGDSADK